MKREAGKAYWCGSAESSRIQASSRDPIGPATSVNLQNSLPPGRVKGRAPLTEPLYLMSSRNIRFEVVERHSALVPLDRPERMNGPNGPMLDELSEGVEGIDSAPVAHSCPFRNGRSFFLSLSDPPRFPTRDGARPCERGVRNSCCFHSFPGEASTHYERGTGQGFRERIGRAHQLRRTCTRSRSLPSR